MHFVFLKKLQVIKQLVIILTKQPFCLNTKNAAI